MHGQLLFNPNDTIAPWTVTFFLSVDVSLPNLSIAQAVERSAVLKQMKADTPTLTDAEVNQLLRVGRALPDTRPNLAGDLFLALTHLRLPAAQRKEREARIAATLGAFFVGVPLPPAMESGLDCIRLIAPLAPDAFLEGMVGSQAARLQMIFMTNPAWATHSAGLLTQVDALATAMGIVSRSEEDRFLFSSFFSRPWADRAAFLELLKGAAALKLAGAVRTTEFALRTAGLLPVFEGDVLVDVLRDCKAAGLDGSMPTEINAVVANQIERAQAAKFAKNRSVLESTIAATRAGAPLGTQVITQNLAAIAAANQAFWQDSLRMTPARLRLRKKLDAAPVAPQNAVLANPVDLDPVQAWSVSRLLRWIEGPIIDAAPAPLDRARCVAQEKTAREEARVKTRMPEKAARADQDMTAQDIELAVQNALSTTAEFFVGDMEDMLFRAKALNSASPAMQACADLLNPLKQLKNDGKPDDQKARALLHQASLAVDLLRLDLRTQASDVRLRQRFAQQLQLALNIEPLVEGKRHGGVIHCPLKRTDWPWVAEQYHRRWLPWTRQIASDGAPRVLQTDQALGLYVTGRSFSSHEFDVSVHLWQRKPGRQTAPGTSFALFAPMNTDDWIDTLTPCAVLHVPSTG